MPQKDDLMGDVARNFKALLIVMKYWKEVGNS